MSPWCCRSCQAHLLTRHPTDAQSAGNVGVGELSGLGQLTGFQTSFFTLTPGEVSWAPDQCHRLSTKLGEAQ